MAGGVESLPLLPKEGDISKELPPVVLATASVGIQDTKPRQHAEQASRTRDEEKIKKIDAALRNPGDIPALANIIDSLASLQVASITPSTVSTHLVPPPIENAGEEQRIGGTVSWRNKSPGNLMMSNIQRAQRIWTGVDTVSNGYVVFNTEESGWNALLQQIRIDAGRGLDVVAFMKKYAPANHANNNPVAYAQYLVNEYAKRTGTIITTDTQLSTLDVSIVAGIIKQYEGWKEGVIIPKAEQNIIESTPIIGRENTVLKLIQNKKLKEKVDIDMQSIGLKYKHIQLVYNTAIASQGGEPQDIQSPVSPEKIISIVQALSGNDPILFERIQKDIANIQSKQGEVRGIDIIASAIFLSIVRDKEKLRDQNLSNSMVQAVEETLSRQALPEKKQEEAKRQIDAHKEAIQQGWFSLGLVEVPSISPQQTLDVSRAFTKLWDQLRLIQGKTPQETFAKQSEVVNRYIKVMSKAYGISEDVMRKYFDVQLAQFAKDSKDIQVFEVMYKNIKERKVQDRIFQPNGTVNTSIFAELYLATTNEINHQFASFDLYIMNRRAESQLQASDIPKPSSVPTPEALKKHIEAVIQSEPISLDDVFAEVAHHPVLQRLSDIDKRTLLDPERAKVFKPSPLGEIVITIDKNTKMLIPPTGDVSIFYIPDDITQKEQMITVNPNDSEQIGMSLDAIARDKLVHLLHIRPSADSHAITHFATLLHSDLRADPQSKYHSPARWDTSADDMKQMFKIAYGINFDELSDGRIPQVVRRQLGSLGILDDRGEMRDPLIYPQDFTLFKQIKIFYDLHKQKGYSAREEFLLDIQKNQHTLWDSIQKRMQLWVDVG